MVGSGALESKDDKEMLTLKPCPFCGTDLSEFPAVMTVQPVRTEEYLLTKLQEKKIIGSDAGYNVFCIHCACSAATFLFRGKKIKNLFIYK